MNIPLIFKAKMIFRLIPRECRKSMEFLTNHIQSSNFNFINRHHVKLLNLFAIIESAEFWVILDFYDALSKIQFKFKTIIQ